MDKQVKVNHQMPVRPAAIKLSMQMGLKLLDCLQKKS